MGALNYLTLGTKRPLRVAAYCRISTEEENEEEGSYAAQRLFFQNAISDHPDWENAGVFGDYARTGTTIRGRKDFQRMLKKAEEGKIDYILTKSISRFSRSATDTMLSLRKLTQLGVGVYFLEQGIDTLGGYGELILAALSSIAEMESESISENTKQSLDAMNAKGTPLRKTRCGYRRNGLDWVIDPEEAIRVKLGFLMAANGFTFKQIAGRLNELDGVDEYSRGWDTAKIKNMLMSETYTGDILTNQWTMVSGEDGKRIVRNDGIDDKYMIEYHHDPLVGRELWERINQMVENKELAGQKNFRGIEQVQRLAGRDHLLDPVREYLPMGGTRCQ